MDKVAQTEDATKGHGALVAGLEEMAAYYRKLATPAPGFVCGDPTNATFSDLFGIIAGLTRVAADQERRIKVLEPCPKRERGEHQWDARTGRKCHACGVTK